MADSNIPKDVLQDLENSGFSFGDDGKIKEGKFLSDDKDDQDDQNDDQQDEDEDEIASADDDDEQDIDTASDDDDEDEPDDDEDDDEDDDDDDDTSSLKLTPRQAAKADDDGEEPLKALKASQDELLERVRKLAEKNRSSDQDDTSDDDDPALEGAAELRAEAQKFKQMRLQMFAKEVERDVNSLNMGASFKDIIASEEWQGYLKSKAYGQTIGTLYVDSIKNNEGDDVVSFFKDFTDRYLPSVSKTKQVSKSVKKAVKSKKDKPSLDDIAMPEKTKATKAPVRKSKYDFVDTDYVTMLDKAERGKISHATFVEFEDKFNKALSNGRVKETS